VPALYVLMDDIARALWWLFSRFVGPGEEAEAELEAPVAATAPPARHHAQAAE
jgi:hypothetical protein